MVGRPSIISFSIVVESQTMLVAFVGPFSFSLVTYGSKYHSHYGSLCCFCSHLGACLGERHIGWMCPLGKRIPTLFALHVLMGTWEEIWPPQKKKIVSL